MNMAKKYILQFAFILLEIFALSCNSLTLIVPPQSATWTGDKETGLKTKGSSSFVQAVERIEKTALHLEANDFGVGDQGAVSQTLNSDSSDIITYVKGKSTPGGKLQNVDSVEEALAKNERFERPVSGLTGEQPQNLTGHKDYANREFSWGDFFGLGTGIPQVSSRRRTMMLITCSLLIAALYLTLRWSKRETRHVAFAEVEEQQSTLVPSLCNFLCQYNYSNSAIPVFFMRMHFPYNKWGVPLWFDFIFVSSAFVGSCLGILVLGVCGDLIGRKKSLQFSLSLITVGALLSAVSIDDFYWTYWWIVMWRFVLGIGIGGCVPLSAVLSNEDTQGLVARALMTGRAFFWCAPGQLAPYAFALGLMELCTYNGLSADNLRVVFCMNNIILGVGAIPAIMALICLYFDKDDPEVFESQKAKTLGRLVEIVTQNPKHCFTLVGTGGSWFILNFAFYGTWMYVPFILFQLQPQLMVHDIEMQSSVVGLTAVPGILMAISLTRQLGLRLLNVVGFLLQAVTYLAMAALLNSNRPLMKIGVLCFLVFALNSGPSVGTYVLPTLCYPSHIRSTFHALSAFLGKLGAFLGAFAAEPIMRHWGMPALFTVHAVLCMVGALLSVAFLRRDADYGNLDKVNMPLGVKRTRSGSMSPRRSGENSPRRRGDHSPKAGGELPSKLKGNLTA